MRAAIHVWHFSVLPLLAISVSRAPWLCRLLLFIDARVKPCVFSWITTCTLAHYVPVIEHGGHRVTCDQWRKVFKETCEELEAEGDDTT